MWKVKVKFGKRATENLGRCSCTCCWLVSTIDTVCRGMHYCTEDRLVTYCTVSADTQRCKAVASSILSGANMLLITFMTTSCKWLTLINEPGRAGQRQGKTVGRTGATVIVSVGGCVDPRTLYRISFYYHNASAYSTIQPSQDSLA